MALTTSACVTFHRSGAPPSVSPDACNMVPMAPSPTTISPAASLRKSEFSSASSGAAGKGGWAMPAASPSLAYSLKIARRRAPSYARSISEATAAATSAGSPSRASHSPLRHCSIYASEPVKPRRMAAASTATMKRSESCTLAVFVRPARADTMVGISRQ